MGVAGGSEVGETAGGGVTGVRSARGGGSLGRVTSGGFSPTLGRPIALAFVGAAHSAPGARLQAVVRGKPQPATVTALPFVPHRYHRNP